MALRCPAASCEGLPSSPMGSPSHSAASPLGITVVCTEHGGCPGHTRENVLCASGRFRASN